MSLEKLRPVLEKCVRCGKCRARCPSLEANEEGTPGWEIYGPRGRMRLAYGLLEGNLPPSKTVADSLFTCFFCNQCVVNCPSLAPITDVIIETRKQLVQDHQAADGIYKLHGTVDATKNMFGMDQLDRVDLWAMGEEELVSRHVGVPADIVYFVGCQASFKGELAGIPVAMVRILDKLGESFSLLGENEQCCGNPLELTGACDEAIKPLAEANVAAIEALGAKRVLFTCPGCYRNFKQVYPGLLGRQLPFEPSMVSEYLLEKIQVGLLRLGPVDGITRVAYHDPCELGRHMGFYDPPRKVISSIPGIQLVEFKETRENSNCCGMGGGVAVHDMAVSTHQARNKSRDIAEAAVHAVVTHCPACFQGIGKACTMVPAGKAGGNGGPPARVLDLVELVALSIGFTS